jgi:hypothetical protein
MPPCDARAGLMLAVAASGIIASATASAQGANGSASAVVTARASAQPRPPPLPRQARLLHPDLPIDALVSLGCGQAPSEARARGVHSMMDTVGAAGRTGGFNGRGSSPRRGWRGAAEAWPSSLYAPVACSPRVARAPRSPPSAKRADPTLPQGALLVEAACSPDRVDEALSTALPLVPGLRYYR